MKPAKTSTRAFRIRYFRTVGRKIPYELAHRRQRVIVSVKFYLPSLEFGILFNDE